MTNNTTPPGASEFAFDEAAFRAWKESINWNDIFDDAKAEMGAHWQFESSREVIERLLAFVRDVADSVPEPNTEHWDLQSLACDLLRDLAKADAIAKERK